MEAVFKYRSWRDKAGSLREGCVGVHRFAKMVGSPEGEIHVVCNTLGCWAWRTSRHGVEKQNSPVFSKGPQQDSHPLWGEGDGIGAPTAVSPLLRAEQEPWVSQKHKKKLGEQQVGYLGSRCGFSARWTKSGMCLGCFPGERGIFPNCRHRASKHTWARLRKKRKPVFLLRTLEIALLRSLLGSVRSSGQWRVWRETG